MIYNNRYKRILTWMLATVLACGSATAQVRVKGSVFGGGNNADVQTNTVVNISAGQVEGNVYGGGNVGDVGTINKTNIRAYKWTDEANPGDTYTYNNTGSCTVSITGGTIGPDGETTPDDKGNVFGAGKGVAESFWCEKAMVYKTTVSITNGTVKGDVYGGGEIGRVEANTTVTIGTAGETGEGSKPAIIGNVFGAGAGLKTHGYSALVRGNTEVTVQGVAKVGKSVYGGGEIATVGKYNLVQKTDVDTEEHRAAFLAAHPGVDPLIEAGMPYSITSDNLGICTVTVKGNATVGQRGSGDVFGAGKGIEPETYTYADTLHMPKRMMSYDSEVFAAGDEGTKWAYYGTGNDYVWEYFGTEEKYNTFVQTLALATQTYVTVDGSAQVNGSVYGGSESGYVQHHTSVTVEGGTIGTESETVKYNVFGGGRGITGNATAGRASGNTMVNILGGTIHGDVYGGGEKGPVGTSTTTTSTTENEVTTTTTTYPTATVNLLGGTITGDAYGGGLGDASTAADAGNTQVNLNGMAINEYTEAFADYLVALNTSPSDDDTTNDYYMVKTDRAGCKVNRIFGANNTNGTPKGNVTVHVYATQSKAEGKTFIGAKSEKDTDTYDLAAVYGGGNEAAYDPATPYENGTGSKSQVIIEGCAYTSIETVYGGGNAAAVPETNVKIVSDYEIGTVFGGGNGKDNKSDGSANPGADIGTKDQGTSTYGTGNANTLITGGYVHEAYGGSNEKGTIMGSVNLDASADGICEMLVKKMVGAGKNADIMGDAIVTLGCMPETWVDEYYGGADNANVHGNVELTITSGNFRKVFGANNAGGIIMGHVKVNIEETGCRPINIDELYLGGNQAAYSRYGYYVVKDEDDAPILNGGKLTFKPRESANDTHPAVKPSFAGSTYQEYAGTENDTFTPYAQPELNIISCTRIGKVFGGGLGETAKMYADPTVNINQIYGTPGGVKSDALGAIGGSYTLNGTPVDGGVFGGGNQATVYGNTTVNIGNLTEVDPVTTPTGLTKNANNKYDVVGANIVGNVYGGGNLADVTGNTLVQVCAKEVEGVYQAVSQGTTGVLIAGNVYGGGKGVADVYRCPKAMVGIDGDGVTHPDGGTSVIIGNGTVGGTVYGGGEIGRVEKNTVVTIGIGEEVATGTATSAPVITGNVFGAGKGKDTHGYAALVRGNATVSVMGNAKVMQSVYGGGEIASVGRYTVAQTQAEATEHDVEVGEPYSLANQNSGNCIVTVGGYAEIGPDNMRMKKADGGPDDTGYVFGAGKGVLPYEGYADSETPWRKTMGTSMTDDTDDGTENYGAANEDAYLKYIGTLALATKTDVTIKDYAFIKGSVYGGSENGRVQHDTDVKIQGHCQIGNGWDKTKNNGAGGGVNARYGETHFINPAEETADVIEGKAAILHECASWDYGVEEDGKMVYHPYDKYSAREGASTTATDGHTFYGNVFGGGSGLYPYKSRKTGIGYEWLRTAGQVSGNTNVTITGGHILTSVYGGCELTDVGNSETLKEGKGKCTVKMSGGTLGVPRTLEQIAAHPVTCYLFGAGKGDQRVHFNQWTNVGSVKVEVSGNAIIYGSVFGGGEDGHVLGDASVTVKENAVIGTWGTSYVDGNIFGAGRGFGGDALTAGVISGNVTVNIEGGTMLGSIYGGGRLASVGTHLVPEENENHGKLIPDGKKQDIGKTELENDPNATHGYININISGGTIGNNLEYIYPTNESMTAEEWTTWKTSNHIPQTEFGTSTAGREDVNRLLHTRGGNVFAGAMGRLYALDGSTVLSHWADMGKARKTTVNISGGHIKSNVYGGGELGTLVEGSEITIIGGTIGTEVKDGNNVKYLFGSVFGGGYGSAVDGLDGTSIEEGKDVTAKDHAGHVLGSTKIVMEASTGDSPTTGTVLGSIYGGGELAWVNGNTDISVSAGTIGRSDVQDENETRPGYVKFGGYRMGNIFGGGKGSTDYHLAGIIKGNATVSVSGGNIYHNIYGGGALGSVGTFTYDETTKFPTACTEGTGTATVSVTGGTIGINGWDNGIVSGSSRGDIQDIKPTEGAYDMHDKLAWVNNSVVTIGTKDATTGPAVKCTVYGGGENGHNLGNTTVTVHSGTIGYSNDVAWECGNVFGAGCGTDVYDHADNEPFYHNPMGGLVKGTTEVTVDGGHVLRSVYGGGSMGSVEGKSTVSVEGGRIGHHVFGGPEGDNDASGDPAHVAETEVNIGYATTPAADNADNTEKLIAGSVYGGGEAGVVYGTVAVNMKGGLVLSDVYGGGALAHTNTSNWSDSNNTWAAGKTSASSTTTVSLTGGTIGGNVYGGGLGRLAKDAVAAQTAQGTEGEPGYVPAVEAQPAVEAIEAKVYGDVLVELNKPTSTTTGEGESATTTTTYGDCEVRGSIFGCNNLNGSPQGGVTVHVYKTVKKESGTVQAKPAKYSDTYELTAVYGGGNLAAFYPDDATTRATAKANVIIAGCDLTSIGTVYGGGNAASVPETDVVINSAYEIGQAFGGGNGADEYTIDGKTYENPGANVGYMSYAYHTWDATANKYMAHEYGSEAGDTKDASTKELRVTNYGTDDNDSNYGTGIAHVSVFGGTVHEVYGGSNTRGNIREESRATLRDDEECDFSVDESYGGGRNALQDGDVVLDEDCISGLGKAYGGASNADVNGDVLLNITNGTYGQVFGGNDQGGCIRGSITVNIEETGCRPIKIGELYGGGNEAAYSVYGYDAENKPLKAGDEGALTTPVASPVVNVRSFSSIGRIFGGGYGSTATMVGNPTVNINVVEGKYQNDDKTVVSEGARVVGSHVVTDATAAGYADGYPIPSHEKNTIGAIQDVFGGGNAAEVVGNPKVNVGTEAGDEVYVAVTPAAGTDVTSYFVRSGEEGAYTYSAATGTADGNATYYQKQAVSVDIRGNVYGGGNNAVVTGNTEVVIGKKKIND